jgi:predicted SnoaL-like aldol condensation-catalyzing enzyme
MLARKTQLNVSLAAKESAYDTAAALDQLLLSNLGAIPQEIVQTKNDQDLTGGNEEATDQEVFAQMVSFPLAFNRVKPTTLLFIGAYGLGSVAVALADTSTPAEAVRQYACTPVDGDLSSFTFEHWYDTALKYRYSGGLVNSFNLSVQRGANRFVSMSAEILGSGTRAAAGSAQTEASESQLNAASAGAWLLEDTGNNADITLAAGEATAGTRTQSLDPATTDLANGGGAAADITTELRSMEWAFSNNINPDDNYRIGGGNVLSDVERGGRTQTLTISLDHVDDVETVRLKNQYNVAFQMIVRGDESSTDSGYYHGFSLIFPQLKTQSVQVVEQGGNLVDQIVYSVLDDPAGTHQSVYFDIFAEAGASIMA